MRIKAKLLLGFGTVAALLIIVGITCYIASNSVLEKTVDVENFQRLDNALKNREIDHLKWIEHLQETFLNNKDKILVQINPKKCAMGIWLAGDEFKKIKQTNPKVAQVIESIHAPHNDLHHSAKDISNLWLAVHPELIQTLYKRLDDHRKWAINVGVDLQEGRTITAEINPSNCHFGKWLKSEECANLEKQWPAFSKIIEEIKPIHELLHKSVTEINNSAPEEKNTIYSEQTLKYLNEVSGRFNKIISMEEELIKRQKQSHEIFKNKTIPALSSVQSVFRNIEEIVNKESDLIAKEQHHLFMVQKFSIIIGSVAGLLIAVFLGWIISANISKRTVKMVKVLGLLAEGDLTINAEEGAGDEIGDMAKAVNQTAGKLKDVISEISSSADHTAASSEELSAAAQNISSGAQNQASSVEEISASMEELTAMIQQAAENAKEANEISIQTNQTAEESSATVKESVNGMSLINESSSQINKIIGVIRQIANQTNLLALNAAIEAASAGEHGLGFAVVADEVRKLAERAGQASNEITQLIEESGKRVAQGTHLSEKVGESLEEIQAGIIKTASGMSEIASATEEQANTASQVSTAIDSISAITEENSSSAEEMAASAEELSAQALKMQTLVNRFKLKK